MEEKERQVTKRQRRKKYKLVVKKKAVLITVICIVLVLGTLTGIAASYDKIYRGVSVCDIDLGGKTVDEAKTILQQQFGEASPTVTITSADRSMDLEFGQFAEYDFDQSAQDAYSQGRELGFITQLTTYYTPFVKHNLPLSFYLNEDTLAEKLNEFQDQLDQPYQETTYQVKGEKLLITTGHAGNVVDTKTLTEKIKEALGFNKPISVEAAVSFQEFNGVDIDDIYDKVFQEPENARYEENGSESKLIPHKLGIDFDKEEAKEIVGEAKPDTTYEIPLVITYPEITEAKLTGQLFSETLATYSTNYNPGEVDRTHNMVLASNKINGTVLNPGQEFSYNKVVGQRTVAAGYRNAKIFENGRVVDGLAGGICQVSSTLYNTALYANMEIVERKNHSFPVAYTPKGQDATVVMGSIDFRFRNSSSHPIKIVSSVSGGKCTVTFLGTKENNFKVKIDNTVVSTTPFSTKYIEDTSLKPGTEKVLQKGSNGYTVKSTRTVTVDGKVVKQESLPTSYYIPLQQEVARNTGEEASPSPSPSVEPTVSPSAKPSPSPTVEPTPVVTPKPTEEPTQKPEPEYTIPPYQPEE